VTKTGSKPSKDRSRGKIIFAGVLFALALLGLWARAYFVQVVKGPEYAKMANRQYWASETVSGKRGEIFDRNGLLLAKTIATPSVYVRPNEVKDAWAVSHRLGSILGVSPKSLAAMLGPKKRFVWVARKISDAQAEAVKAEMLPGVYLETENSRQYPQGHMAGQLLGFVNMDGRGIEGLESSFNDLLVPSSTKYTVQKDAAGKRLSSLESGDRNSFNGQDLRLTLDSQVQLATEEALARSVIRAKGKSGMALVVEVPTGEILAWGHYPFLQSQRGQEDAWRVEEPHGRGHFRAWFDHEADHGRGGVAGKGLHPDERVLLRKWKVECQRPPRQGHAQVRKPDREQDHPLFE